MVAPAVQRERRPTTTRPARKQEIKQQGGFYKAGGKQVPDARRVQEDSNEKKISLEIIDRKQTDEYADIIVRAWLPDMSQYEDGVVHHQFSTIRELKALEFLEKEISGSPIYFRGSPIQMFQDLSQPFNKNGDPILTGVGYLKLLTEMARFKNFAMRDAKTKAGRIAKLNLLNREWRDKDEIQSEKDEENSVRSSIADEKASRTQKPAPANKRKISKTDKSQRGPRQPETNEEQKDRFENETLNEPDNVQEGQLTGASYWKQLATENKTLEKVLKHLDKEGFDIIKVNILEGSADLIGDSIDADERREFLKYLKDKEDQ